MNRRSLGLVRVLVLCTLAAAISCIAGCGSSTSSGTPPPPPGSSEPNNCKSTNVTSPAQAAPVKNYTLPSISGSVRAGSSPVAGSTVQLYAVGTTGNGSSPTALLTSTLTADADGAFSVPASITCPYSNSVVYLLAKGGSVSSAPSNSAIEFLAVLGTCASVHTGQTVVVDEATTIASAFAMAQFIAAGGQIGASASNTTGIALAAATATNLADLATGEAPASSFPPTGTAPVAKMDALANALNACATSSAPCTQLFAAFTTNGTAPTNTLDAAMNVARSPAANAASIFSLTSGSSAYLPTLAAAPADWTLSANYSGGGMNGPTAVSIDSQGNIWVANYFNAASLFTNLGAPVFSAGISGNGLLESYGGAVDVNDTMWVANEQSPANVNSGLGSLTLLNNSCNSPAQYTNGDLNFPIAVAFDTGGVTWIANYGDSHITLLNPNGSPLSGSNGYTAAGLQFPSAIATDSKCNAYVANESSNTITRVLADGSAFNSFVVGQGPASIAIDSVDNVWSANFYANSVGLVSPDGTVPSGNGYTGGGLNAPRAIAVDGSGNAWVASERGTSLAEFAAASSSKPGALLSPSAGWGSDAMLSQPYALAIDAAGNIWVSNYTANTLTEFIGLAAPVKTPLLGPVRVP